MRIIKKNKKIIAMIFDGRYKKGTHGITPPVLALQVISLNYAQGKVWPAHMHKPIKRVTNQLMEVFFLLQGKARVDILLHNKLFKTFILKSGQGLMMLEGAMRIEALTPVVALEFKNGPFIEDKVLL